MLEVCILVTSPGRRPSLTCPVFGATPRQEHVGVHTEVRPHRQLLQGCRRLSSHPLAPCLPTARAAPRSAPWGALPGPWRNRSLQESPEAWDSLVVEPGWWPLSLSLGSLPNGTPMFSQ